MISSERLLRFMAAPPEQLALIDEILAGRLPAPAVQPAATAPPAPEGYIDKEELAKRLKKTVRTVENWQAKGFLPFVKIGRSALFKWADVETHLQENFSVCRSGRR